MRTFAKSMLAAAVAAVVTGSAANAVTLTYMNDPGYVGPLFITYSNWDVGKIYKPTVNTPVDPNGANLVNAADPAAAALVLHGTTGNAYSPNPNLEDTWGIAQVSAIYEGVDNTGTLLYDKNISGEPQVTGIYWGGQDVQVTNTPGIQDIYTTAIQMSFFVNTVHNFPAGGGFASNRTNPGGIPSFTGVTDGTLLWTLNGTPGISAANPLADMHTNINLTLLANPAGQAVGSGSMGLNVGPNVMGTGNQNNLLGLHNPSGPDVTVQFTDKAPTHDWTVTSSDPASVYGVPTPSAVWGGALLAGLVGVNVYRRRRAE